MAPILIIHYVYLNKTQKLAPFFRINKIKSGFDLLVYKDNFKEKENSSLFVN